MGDGSSSDLVGDDAANTREARKAESRRRIMESAREVFFRDGFMTANLDEVAEKAGVAKGTLYRYFESKADLYVAVLAENGRVFADKMRDSATLPGSSLDKIRRISAFYLEHWLRHPDYFQIFWAIENQPVIGDLPGAVVEEVSRLWEQSLAIVKEVLDDAVASGELAPCDTWEVADILWSLANALIQSNATAVRRKLRGRPLEEVFPDAIELILRGLKAGNSPPESGVD